MVSPKEKYRRIAAEIEQEFDEFGFCIYALEEPSPNTVWTMEGYEAWEPDYIVGVYQDFSMALSDALEIFRENEGVDWLDRSFNFDGISLTEHVLIVKEEANER